VKFLVDAHLPPSLVAALGAMGHDAVHTRDLPAGNQTRDGVLNEISLRDQRIVISKDTDFFYSHILHSRPWKLVLVRTGNISAGELRALFSRHLPAILAALQTHSLVEIDRQAVVTPLR
jgi:predicted nuclease of predicted toxin-antitoxin system